MKVSIPDPVFDATERLAKERHVSRSQLFLQEYAQLEEIYGVEESSVEVPLAQAQLASVEHETW